MSQLSSQRARGLIMYYSASGRDLELGPQVAPKGRRYAFRLAFCTPPCTSAPSSNNGQLSSKCDPLPPDGHGR